MLARRAFLTLGGCGALALLPHRLSAQPRLSLAYLEAVPGYIAVHARTMGTEPPVVSYHDGDPYPTASTIKVLIMVTAFRWIDAGKISPSTPVAISAADMVGGSDTYGYAIPGTKYPLMSLIHAMIKQSDNTASNALISHFGFAAINATTVPAGMTSTHLRRHFLDWAAIVAHNENISTARDMSALLYQIERGSREGLDTIAKADSCRKMIEIMLGQEDRDKIPAGLPPGTQVANKTGEITGVRSDVAIVEPFGETPYILVVMTKELRDYSAGISAIRRVAHDVNRTINSKYGLS
ncbi:MAG: serine hydrolase [Vulcanimicrobiaceae bacterium]|jgi:beta-lactamase class A